MPDLSHALPDLLAEQLGRAVDPEAKIVRALDALGPVVDRDVLVVGDDPVYRTAARMAGRAASVDVTTLSALADPTSPIESASADIVVVDWPMAGQPSADGLAGARRVLRPDGRLLIVHDYGRDDVSRFLEPPPEHDAWSRKNGPFLGAGFRIRVIHTWWSFDTLEAAAVLLAEAFGAVGEQVGAGLSRPRLSYNVAIYHRSFGPS